MTAHEKKRVVAIIGRPNVGKSSIFNRLVGRRSAIVHHVGGTTRDRLEARVSMSGGPFQLVDTGGVWTMDGKMPRDAIGAGIRAQICAALRDAAAALFVVDAKTGMTPLDEEVARLLRSGGCPAVVAANKADNTEQDAGANDFHRLGFRVFPVSALHNRGFDPLLDAIEDLLPPAGNSEQGEFLKVAIVGRPNVGKSSYINKLIGSERVLVAGEPGTTRDSVDIRFTVGAGSDARRYLLTDTAGLRRRGKITRSLEKFARIRTEGSIAACDVAALILDAAAGPTEQDKKIGSMIVEQGKGCVLLMNKWDLVRGKQRDATGTVRRVMPFLSFCPVVLVSAATGYNMERSMAAIDLVASQTRARLPTGPLNRALRDAQERVRPPRVKGRQLKVFYATQVGTAPVRIQLHVNHPESATKPYLDYLVRSLREKFGLDGAPVLLEMKGRRPGDR